ncbi:MAG: hypothetical protein A2Y25_04500 [Candidatus Melainabacteria bacterium GWF2_37_15]|nr:MAG: hypothetical protein A2Y25_04500 [Candidatus Melainabacteria bacterium GWF2_37_15]
MNKSCFKKSRKGAAIVISMFISVVAALMTIVMMGMVNTNTSQITDNKSGTIAYYAAESGVEEVKNYFNRNMSSLGEDLSALPLPENGSSFVLANNAEYYVDSLSYENANTMIVVDVVGQYGTAYRKIHAKLNTEIPSVFNDYGLLTNGVLTITGDTTLNMDVHANGGAEIPDNANLLNNAAVTQSAPINNQSYPDAQIVPTIYVPVVPINDLRTQSQIDNIILDINQADLQTQIANAPAGSKIYIGGTAQQINQNNVNLSGNMQGKTIFLDGNITIDVDGANPLSNATVITAGSARITGGADIQTSHPDEIDVVFACGGNLALEGQREFTGLFWVNGEFKQDGASTLTGRVVAEDAIFMHGAFVQTTSNKVSDNDIFDKVVSTSSWQMVSMD